jgi:hypothetical protein
MYVLNNWRKFLLVFLIVGGYSIGSSTILHATAAAKTELSTKQLEENHQVTDQMLVRRLIDNDLYVLGWVVTLLTCMSIFWRDVYNGIKSLRSRTTAIPLLLLICVVCTGCYRPFEPIKLEVVGSNEEAFLLPYLGDGKNQSSSSNEEYLKANLVFTKQVKIPQQWVQHGYEWMGANGSWKDAAILIKVDKSPVTREWTADAASGTSNKNEAVWVMTSDQVEFSTGWTITARIDSRDAAVKFLHNYPNGSLEKVLDSEVRAKLQAVFGLEVTDLPMDELRKSATPHIKATTQAVEKFFETRGITITNIGITGGFVYKDKSIIQTMVKVFNAEQEKNVAIAQSAAQEELNKKVIFEATGKADALLKTKKAEADGIKMVADAKVYELEKAAEQLAAYVTLKQLEIQKEQIARWDGRFPGYFFSSGGSDNHPSMLLQLPAVEPAKAKSK